MKWLIFRAALLPICVYLSALARRRLCFELHSHGWLHRLVNIGAYAISYKKKYKKKWLQVWIGKGTAFVEKMRGEGKDPGIQS